MSSDSGDSEMEPSRAERRALKYALFTQISQIQSAGSFAAFGEIKHFVHPGISINSGGVVGLPLSQEDAQALVQISRQAPFGNGSETVVDTSVRRTWEIDAAAVSFLNPKWQSCLDEIVQTVTRELGIAGGPGNIRAELYKMLLYEKGAMFKSHKDTERIEGMFGTLVICLPSKHDGGTVCLEHGQKRRRLHTSDSSAFGATYLAWYADVFHEIEPVQSGYRWVLTYNLINNSRGQKYSALGLDAQTEGLTRLLTQWENLDDQFQCLAYPMEHQYTNRGLKLALLKGNDSCRARRLAQGCEEHGQFYVFLANMELCVKDFQSEDDSTESELYVEDVVDTDGFNLMVHDVLQISESILLERVHGEHRRPDVQLGGGYMGNSHAEIEQFYQDSVMILIPKRQVLSFLATRRPSVYSIGALTKKLEKRVEIRGYNQASKEMLSEICQRALSLKWANANDKDSLLGHIAVAAAFLKESSLFVKAVDKVAEAFAPESYSELGRLISFSTQVSSNSDISEREISEDSFIRALTTSRHLYVTYNALHNFQSGFLQANPGRDRIIPKDYVKRWVDSITTEYLNDLQFVSEEDAKALVRIILDRGDNDFRQNLLYQSVRTLVSRFHHEKNFLIALTIELFISLPESGSSHKYLHSLLRRILESAISSFDLEFYAKYVRTHHVRGPDFENRAGPIGAFYDSLDEQGQTKLLDNFQTQSSTLSNEQERYFLPALLEELIKIVDASSPKVQECVQSLVDTYIMHAVGKEPAKPFDWSRPEEKVSFSSATCDCLRQLNDFLVDPKATTYELSCNENPRFCHIYYKFTYMDREYDCDKVTFSKTTRMWEEAHKKWDLCASEALSNLRKLPQEKLKHCLANQYDEAMNLQKVTIGEDSPRLQGTVVPSKSVANGE